MFTYPIAFKELKPLKKFTIQYDERGILLRNGRVIRWLEPGNYNSSFFFYEKLAVINTKKALLSEWDSELEKIIPKKNFEIIEIPRTHRGILYANGLPKGIVSPGKYITWQFDKKVKISQIDITPLQIEWPQDALSLLDTYMKDISHISEPLDIIIDSDISNQTDRNLITLTVPSFKKVAIYSDGSLEKVLETGRYTLSRLNREITLVVADKRELQLQIKGQEILSLDNISLKISLILKYKISEPIAAFEKVDNLKDSLYTEAQLALREFISDKKLEELINSRNYISMKLREKLQKRLTEWGIELIRVDIKDLTFPAELKRIFTKILNAHKTAEANAILRREETANIRSLANIAKQVERHPSILKLKEFETIKELSEKITNFTLISGNPPLIPENPQTIASNESPRDSEKSKPADKKK